jgi:hypothetical protein
MLESALSLKCMFVAKCECTELKTVADHVFVYTYLAVARRGGVLSAGGRRWPHLLRLQG